MDWGDCADGTACVLCVLSFVDHAAPASFDGGARYPVCDEEFYDGGAAASSRVFCGKPVGDGGDCLGVDYSLSLDRFTAVSAGVSTHRNAGTGVHRGGPAGVGWFADDGSGRYRREILYAI